MDTFSFLEAYSSLKIFSQRWLFCVTMLHHTMTPKQERRLPLSLYVLSAGGTHSFWASPEIWNCTPLKKLLPSGMQASLNPLQVTVNPSLSCHHSHLWAKYNLPPPLPRQLLTVPRLNQTHHPRSEIIKVLRRVTSVQFQWLLGAACLWKYLTNETVTLGADGMKEVGNARITLIQKARAHTVSIPRSMIMVGHLSMADLLNLVVLQGIPFQRNNEFTVKVDHMIMNTNTPTHQSLYVFCHLPSFILLP